MVSYEGLFWSDAKKCHDNLVHAMELMGLKVISEEINAKKKRPMRRQPHRAQSNNIYTVSISRMKGERNDG